MTDLAAARERHYLCDGIYCEHTLGMQHCADCDPDCANGWPCDFALAIEALDDAKAVEQSLSTILQGQYDMADASRALADELGRALVRVRRVADDCWCGTSDLIHTDDCLNARTALAKWEASR